MRLTRRLGLISLGTFNETIFLDKKLNKALKLGADELTHYINVSFTMEVAANKNTDSKHTARVEKTDGLNSSSNRQKGDSERDIAKN